jgi:hypothetical protein
MEPIELICETEDAIQAIEALGLPDNPEPLLQRELLQRLEHRLEFLNSLLPVFRQPADWNGSGVSRL